MSIIVTPSDIYKQLVINSLCLPEDIQECIKTFVFYHESQVKAIRNKKGLINSFKKGLNYDHYMDAYGNSYWTLSFRYERMLTSVNCACCGSFKYTYLPKNITCSCGQNHNRNQNNQAITLFM